MQQPKETKKKVIFSSKIKTHKRQSTTLKSRRESIATSQLTMKRTVIYHIGDNAATHRVTTQGPDLSFQAYILIQQEEFVLLYCPADGGQLYIGALCIFGNR